MPAQRLKPKDDAPANERAPRTARGERTRAKLVAAARKVFERDGYLNVRLSDISAEAGTAAGSFYTYFSGKEEIFAAVLDSVQEEMLHPHVAETTDSDPIATIEASTRAYLASYRRNAKLMRLLEQVATIDDDFREVRRLRGQAFSKRNARGIRDLQARGLADPGLDPLLMANALSSMVARMAYNTYVLGDGWTDEELVSNLTRAWCNALGIPPGAATASATATGSPSRRGKATRAKRAK